MVEFIDSNMRRNFGKSGHTFSYTRTATAGKRYFIFHGKGFSMNDDLVELSHEQPRNGNKCDIGQLIFW